MESRAKLFGHSIHAMLITFPVGLFVTAIVFDIIYLAGGGTQWTLVSYRMIIAGVIGGLAAAVFGYIDYRAISTNTRAHRVGRLHGIGNVVLVVLFILSWWVRRASPEQPPSLAFVFSFVGIALAAVTAWLGGELVERLGVGVDDGANLDAPSSLSGRVGTGASTHASNTGARSAHR